MLGASMTHEHQKIRKSRLLIMLAIENASRHALNSMAQQNWRIMSC
jgi:hypothetical protein